MTNEDKKLFERNCLVTAIVVFAFCWGCLTMLKEDPSPERRINPQGNSVNEDIRKFDSHFPDASEEERRLTKELYEQDERRQQDEQRQMLIRDGYLDR